MSEDLYRSQFRMPYSLYEKIKESADANRRSVNAELVARLQQSFEPALSRPQKISEAVQQLVEICEDKGVPLSFKIGRDPYEPEAED